MQDPDSQLAFSKFRMLALRTFVVQAQSRKWHVLVSPETSDQAANAALKPSKNTGKPIMFLKGVRWYRERMHAGSYCLGSLPARTVAQRHKSPAALAEVLGPSHFYVAMTLDSIANLKDLGSARGGAQQATRGDGGGIGIRLPVTVHLGEGLRSHPSSYCQDPLQPRGTKGFTGRGRRVAEVV